MSLFAARKDPVYPIPLINITNRHADMSPDEISRNNRLMLGSLRVLLNKACHCRQGPKKTRYEALLVVVVPVGKRQHLVGKNGGFTFSSISRRHAFDPEEFSSGHDLLSPNENTNSESSKHRPPCLVSLTLPHSTYLEGRSSESGLGHLEPLTFCCFREPQKNRYFAKRCNSTHEHPFEACPPVNLLSAGSMMTGIFESRPGNLCPIFSAYYAAIEYWPTLQSS